MALLRPIVHCVIDQEPKSFHQTDNAGETISFAVNLSFEAPSDGTLPDIGNDEAAAEKKFLAFLHAVQRVQLHLYVAEHANPRIVRLTHYRALGPVSEPLPLGHPSDLHNWLKAQEKASAFRDRTRYWATLLIAPGSSADIALDVNATAATHRLRAAQAWNAPVAHKFALTHIVRLPADAVAHKLLVVLPFFPDDRGSPAGTVLGTVIDGSPRIGPETALGFDYDMLGTIGPAGCRTTMIGEGLTQGELNLPGIDPALTPEGYLKIDKDAESVHRFLTWFEARAASLTAVNGALNSLAEDAEVDKSFEELFGLRVVTENDQDGKPTDTFHWGSLVWFVVARLLTTLDNFVLGILKPVQSEAADGPAFDRSSEGDILAPLVTRLREELDAIAGSADLKGSALEAEKITAALRTAIATASPLIASTQQRSNADLVQELCRVYGIDPPNDGTPQSPVDARELIFEALARYAADNNETKLPGRIQAYAARIKGKSAAIVARALADLEQPLQEEAGAEAVILKLIDRGKSVANQIATAYLKEIEHPEPAKALAAVETAVDRALANYRRLLDSPFNGAEATRRAASSAFVRNLLDFAKLPDADENSSAALADFIASSGFYARRLGVGDAAAPAACFEPLAAALVVPDHRFLLAPQGKVRKHLEAAFRTAIEPLAAVNDPNARFIPDSTPQPLAIQIAANIDGSKLDAFAKHFNGIAVAIRRRDTGEARDRWAHAHLADLDWTPENATPIDPLPVRGVVAALHPMLPAISDGRGAMFIEYEGFPFADAASDARIVDNEEETQEKREKRKPFYRHAPHQPIYPGGGPPKPPPVFAQVPRLAYGRWFDTFSFVTTNAGTLPLALQRKGDPSPWMPDPNIQEPDRKLIGDAPYQRRTAIAQMAVIEEVTGAQSRRIGAPIAGVFPLAADYPRVGLMAETGVPAVRDIFREADGSGRMIVDEIPRQATQPPPNAEWRIGDMRFSGIPNKLILRFFDRHATHDDRGKEFIIDANKFPGFVNLKEIVVSIVHRVSAPSFDRRLTVRCNGVPLADEALSGTGALAGWLRLQLEAGGQPVTLTFADPGEQKTDNVAAPLLLLAPDKSGAWKSGLAEPVTATVSTPRVGYLDFERWFANGSLYASTFGVSPEDPHTHAASFMRALLTAYVMRHLHPPLAELINRLPDPAVEEVRLELTALDRLSDLDPGPGRAERHALAGKLKEFAKRCAPDKQDWRLKELLHSVLQPLDELFRFTIRLAPAAGPGLNLAGENGDKSGPRRYVASVPAGVVARLSIDALVSADRFKPTGHNDLHPAVFHEGLKQYAPRAVGAFLAFPAAAIRVETMYDDRAMFPKPKDDEGKAAEHFNELAVGLATRMIFVEGIERVRRFDLMSATSVEPIKEKPNESPNEREILTRRWRVLGEIDTTTQGFRSGGRPIYHYVNPREHRDDGLPDARAEVKHPALPLRLKDGGPELSQFELEAFFDRPDVDAHTVTQRLDPLPSRTKLQEHHWNSEAASYFRHRFTLRSRYAGALVQADRREVNAWPNDKDIHPARRWTHRVAMLADLSRMLLTRPQLRALIPLTTAPGGEDMREPAPPVAAILQEPPFARGGLADRTAAEIKTGFGYGFENSDPKSQVEILDSRKEGGPDPQLDYRPLNVEAALGLVLRSEGPIGLTFDNVNAPAPALPNTMMLLKPDTLFRPDTPKGGRAGFEEFFTGVALRRYIDPGWTMSRRESEGPLDGERCWWIDDPTESPGEHTLLQYTVEGDASPRMLLTVKIDGSRVALMTSKRTIDGVGSETKDRDKDRDKNKDPVKIALIEEATFGGLSILHQPVAPGRYSTAVFMRAPSARTERGEANLPLVVASFEWSPHKPGGAAEDTPPVVQIVPTKAAAAYATMASAPTSLKWTRTGRDFDFVHVAFDEHREWQPQRRHVREIVADLNPDHKFLTFRYSGANKDTPTWLLPSTFASPYPLHVHRHLGLITSRFLKELGTPAEIFCRTSADPKLKHDLVAPHDPPAPPAGAIFRPQEQVVRVIEFETPAAILTAGSTAAVPQTYKQAYFDLIATGFKLNDKMQGHLRLFFRFVGSPLHVRAFKAITLELWRAAERKEDRPPPADIYDLKVKFDNTDKSFTIGLEVVLQRDGDKPTTVTVRRLRSDGKLEPVTPVVPRDKTPFRLSDAGRDRQGEHNSGFLVAIANVEGGGEFWTDVSLLHGSRTRGASPFDFGWLFSPTAEAEPAALVAPMALTAMVEAQARIVAVSPPIPIVSH